MLLSAGLIWLETEYVTDADYRKWLGPDWKPKWEGSGTIVMNHISWLDIWISKVLFYPAAVAKAAVKKYPFLGTLCTAMDSIYINRAGTKEEKQAMVK